MRRDPVLTLGDGEGNWCFFRWSEATLGVRIDPDTDLLEYDIYDDLPEVQRG